MVLLSLLSLIFCFTDTASAKGVWSVSAVQCAVKDLHWPPFELGFSLAVWFSLDALSSAHSAQPSHAGTSWLQSE